MYLPQHFEETKQGALHRIIDEFPLGALVVNGPDGLDADHLPFELDPGAGERGRLRAHVARANPLWRQVRDGDHVLVVFRAGDAYVSPNWYPSKHETHRQVPTWNYRVVHVHGRIAIRDDERYVRGVVARLTRVHEGRSGAERPWRMTDSSREFVDAMLAAIVGIEIAIDRIVGKSKLGQNREARDRAAAADALARRGHAALSAAMLGAGPSAKPEG
jgi:transcriptional regulator